MRSRPNGWVPGLASLLFGALSVVFCMSADSFDADDGQVLLGFAAVVAASGASGIWALGRGRRFRFIVVFLGIAALLASGAGAVSLASIALRLEPPFAVERPSEIFPWIENEAALPTVQSPAQQASQAAGTLVYLIEEERIATGILPPAFDVAQCYVGSLTCSVALPDGWTFAYWPWPTGDGFDLTGTGADGSALTYSTRDGMLYTQ